MSDLISLPQDVLFSMLGKLELDQLGKICASSKEIKEICESYDFWNRKYFAEFGEYLSETNSTDWKKVYLESKCNRLKSQIVKLNTNLWNQMDEDIKATFENEPEYDTIYYDIVENLANNYFKIDYGSTSKPWINESIKSILNENEEESDYDIETILSDVCENNNVGISVKELGDSMQKQIEKFKELSLPIAKQIREMENRLTIM